MTEEESFVILGSSPTPSMQSINSINNIPSTSESLNIQQTNNIEQTGSFLQGNKNDSVSSTNEAYSLLTHSNNIITTTPPTTSKTSQMTTELKLKTSIQKSNSGQEEMNPKNSLKSENESVPDKSVETIIERDKKEKLNNNKTIINNASTSLNSMSSNSNSSSYGVPYSILNLPSTSGLTKKNNENNKQNSQMNNSKNNSLAASFLLGDIDMNVIKENVFSQFPSLCTVETRTDDIVKLQKFLTEYDKLKENLHETNAHMVRYFSTIENWKEEIRENEKERELEMKGFRKMIDDLYLENKILKREINQRVELIKMHNEGIELENHELRKAVSEQTSVIQNLSAEIEKLDKQSNLFECIGDKNDKSSIDSNTEFIPIVEHKKIIDEKDRKLSELLAENLELKNMQQIYIDEINCLKVNLVSAEELLKKANADIDLLKCKDLEKTKLFENYEKDKNEMKQEINALRVQLEVYNKDFQIERNCREKLAGEKNQLLHDLKLLQKRNQKLIEETRSRFDQEVNKNENMQNSQENAQSRNRSEIQKNEGAYGTMKYICPLCNREFKNIDLLQNHVQDCVDKI